METNGVLVLGCSDESTNSGLKADERAIAAHGVPAATVSTGYVKSEGAHVEVVAAAPSTLRDQIDVAMRTTSCKVVKIGALFSDESIQTVSELLRQDEQLTSVIDVEPFFKTGPRPEPEVMASLRKNILPRIGILSATVPEAKSLLDESGSPVDYPKSIEDVKSMADALRCLGPDYVIIKREIYDEGDGATTLHYVLSGGAEAVMETFRCQNPRGFFGASYSIPPMIAARLAEGLVAPDAVSASFKFAQEMLEDGQFFD